MTARYDGCRAMQRWRAGVPLDENVVARDRTTRALAPSSTMQRLTALVSLAAVPFVAACSGGEPAPVPGETSVIVAERGTGFTSEQRAADAAAGVETVETAPKQEPEPSTVQPSEADASTLVVGGVDPTLAAKLKADPSAYAASKIENLVTFRMLSLAGVDLDSLLDYLFSPETERAKAFKFPEAVQALDGKEAAIVGYMIPLEYKPKTDEIKVFMLVRDLMACCFGGAPRPDEWVYVEMDGDSSSKLYPYLPIVVRGKLKVGRLEDEFGLSSGVYSMKSTDVSEFKPE